MTIEEALVLIEQKNPQRFPHVHGVYETATQLAKKYHVNGYQAQLAALLHDYAKNEPMEKQEAIIKKYFADDYLNHAKTVYHGPVGRYLVENKLNIHDEVVLKAIECHVTGIPAMDDIAKVVYISDYIEPGRTHEMADYGRYLSGIGLDVAVLGIADVTIDYLQSKQADIHPFTIQTYEYYLKKVGVDYYESIKNNYFSSR